MSETNRARWNDAEPGEEQFRAELASTLGRTSSGRCPEPALLIAAQSDALPEAVRQRVLAHLENCPTCRQLLPDLSDPEIAGFGADIAKSIRRRLPSREPAPRKVPGWWWAVAVAASVLLAFVYFLSRDPRKLEVASAPPAPAPAPKPARLKPLTLVKPPIQLPATALLFRGGEGKAESPLLQAMGAFRSEDYGKAANALAALVEKDKETAEIRFYLGVSLLFLDRSEEAVKHLEAAQRLAEDGLGREAAWYLAIAHQRRGAEAQALRAIEALCASAGAHREEACGAARTEERRQ